jgi:hypothetical protein
MTMCGLDAVVLLTVGRIITGYNVTPFSLVDD